VLLKRKFSDRLRSEIGRLDVKDIVTDSRGRLTLEVRDALNSGSAGTEDELAPRRLTTRLLKRQSVLKPKPTVKCR
jgi:regulator of protease activity HflC (stomatin/prohibitin superfamily)